MSEWLLRGFNHWFTSRGGVLQTAFLTLAICTLELTGVLHDANGLWLLYWLTVYSAITQPALAYAGRISAEEIEEVLRRVLEDEERIAALAQSIAAHVGGSDAA